MPKNEQGNEILPSVIPRSAVATPDQVKAMLTLTDEAAAELQKQQKLELYRSRAILSPEERQFARGIELEEHYKKTGDKDGLAEALSFQGKYAEAAEIAVREDLKAEYAEKAAAVASEDVNCKCDDFRTDGEFNLPNQHVEFVGHSEKHNASMPFIRCQVCGELNARAMPQHLAEQKELRNSDATETERKEFFKI
jgi:hypothetical protein